MALYTDEDMSALVATLLRSRGFDVATAPEQATLGKTEFYKFLPAKISGIIPKLAL